MALIRPEAAALLSRYSEVLFAAALGAGGLWLGTRGGWLLGAMGLLVVGLGVVLALMGLQRLRLTPDDQGPGVVEVDEGQIAWYGPGLGGYVAVQELSEIGLATVGGIRVWRFLQRDGQILLVPVGAKGVEAMFDALTALPGLEIGQMILALEGKKDTAFLWRADTGNILRFPNP